MANYVANHEKKKRIFAKRERELLHAIKNDHEEAKLLFAAEEVRSAKINVFKCEYARTGVNQPHKFVPEEVARENKKLADWLACTASELVEKYRARLREEAE